VVPAGISLFAFDAASSGLLAFEQIQRKSTQDSKVLWGMACSNPALIIAQADVELPVPAHGAGTPNCVQGQAGKVVAPFDCDGAFAHLPA
jgi:hypothetical protein